MYISTMPGPHNPQGQPWWRPTRQYGFTVSPVTSPSPHMQAWKVWPDDGYPQATPRTEGRVVVLSSPTRTRTRTRPGPGQSGPPSSRAAPRMCARRSTRGRDGTTRCPYSTGLLSRWEVISQEISPLLGEPAPVPTLVGRDSPRNMQDTHFTGRLFMCYLIYLDGT